MFPYVDTTHWSLGPVVIRPFPILMGLGMAAGYTIAARRAARDGIQRETIAELTLWMIGAGLVGAYLFKVVYSPAGLAATIREPVRLLRFSGGIASLGGFLGGILGASAFMLRHNVAPGRWLGFLEPFAFAIPFAWSIGRIGCYLVHDHPGIRTTSWLGVPYPGGARYDLGLLEVFFLAALGGVFLLLDRKPRVRGFFWTAFLISYGTFRILLDRLHVDPPRYFGLTVDFMGSIFLIGTGVATFLFIRRKMIRT